MSAPADANKELAAMIRIYEILEPLSPEQRVRVLGAVLCLIAEGTSPARDAIAAWKELQE